MIEIIRQEDTDGSSTQKELPKDIKQIGSPDIGERIYVEDGAYQALHPYNSAEEKRAYVLLGKFENCSGRQCVFVEAVIPLLEMEFDGELPLWNDHTWAYIYKQLKREYDSMVIVGWAMDIKGQLPNMTVRLEQLHQNHFGGAHQLLFLMDSLEREEAFYSNRNGHLYRREGFYIYYDKKRAKMRDEIRRVAEQTYAEAYREEDEQSDYAGSISVGVASEIEEAPSDRKDEHVQAAEMSFEERMHTDEQPLGSFFKKFGTGAEQREELKKLQTGAGQRGEYRKRVMEEEAAKKTPSYASTLLLAMVVCALGVAAYLNHEKMAAMEETLAQMRQIQAVSTEEGETEQTEGTELADKMPAVEVETVAGNVEKQEDANTADDTVAVSGNAADTTGNAADTTGNVAGTADSVATSSETDSTTGSTGDSQSTAAADGADTSGSTDAADTGSTDTSDDAAAASSTAATTEAQTYLAQGYYIVQKGDNLVGICRKIYQTTAMLDKLCEVNGIEDENSIYAGQYLILPN